MLSATSGDRRSRRRRFGSGLIGRSGYIEDMVSGDISRVDSEEYRPKHSRIGLISHLFSHRRALPMNRESIASFVGHFPLFV